MGIKWLKLFWLEMSDRQTDLEWSHKTHNHLTHEPGIIENVEGTVKGSRLTINWRKLPVTTDCCVATEGEVEPSSMLGSITVPRGQNQGLVVPARCAQILPGIIAHQNRAVIIHIQNMNSHQCGGWQGGIAWWHKTKRCLNFLVFTFVLAPFCMHVCVLVCCYVETDNPLIIHTHATLQNLHNTLDHAMHYWHI